jgi:hypothetical protein
MSTRSILIYTNEKETIRVYKHFDGYPTGNLPVIKESLEGISNLEKFIKGNDEIPLASIIRYFKDDEKLEIEFQGKGHFDPKQRTNKFKKEVMGEQSDLEWVYVIDLTNKKVSCYGNNYGEAKEHFKKGITDPITYVKCLYPQYQEKERQEIEQAIEAIQTIGFKVGRGKKN